MPAGVTWHDFVPYVLGTIVAVISVWGYRKDIAAARGADKLIRLGPVFLAVSMAVYAGDHFGFAKFVAMVVPAFMPWRPFWVFFVGTCLLICALALALRKRAGLAAGLFGVMLLLFEVLMHIPRIAHAPSDRFAWATALRDLIWGAGALAYAATQTWTLKRPSARTVITYARLVIGVSIIVFGVECLMYPEFRPGFPHEYLTPLWIPGRLLWSYVTGVVYVIAGLGLIGSRSSGQRRLAALSIGVMALVLVFAMYLPNVVAKPFPIEGGLNDLIGALFTSAAALCLTGALLEGSVPRQA